MEKKQKISIPTDLSDQVRALIEDFNSKMDLVLEQTSEIPKIKKNVDKLTDDLELVKADVDVIKADMGIMKEDVVTMKGDVNIIKNLLKKKVDVDEFAALEHRVALLESRR